jgi:hypothetical protein
MIVGPLLRGDRDDDLRPFLKPHLFETYRKAARNLQRRPEFVAGINARAEGGTSR